MTERTIFSGAVPQVVIRSGGDVLVKGWDQDRVLAEGSGSWGLQVKRKKNTIEVQIGGNGQVSVPYGGSVKVYAGKNATIEQVQGTVTVYAGWDARIIAGNILAQASAGRALEIDCRQVEGQDVKFSSGWHLRCWIRELKNGHYWINDLGGKWQAVFGDGSTTVRLNAGGDVTLVSDQSMRDTLFADLARQGPMGKITRPGEIGL